MEDEKKTGKPRLKFGQMLCSRTSAFLADKSPCDEAVKVMCVEVDKRSSEWFARFPQTKDDFYRNGRNHRIDADGLAVRDIDRFAWVVQIDDGDALLAFVEKYGDVILREDVLNDAPCVHLELYDDYRE